MLIAHPVAGVDAGGADRNDAWRAGLLDRRVARQLPETVWGFRETVERGGGESCVRRLGVDAPRSGRECRLSSVMIGLLIVRGRST
jgi:hypothetical protein